MLTSHVSAHIGAVTLLCRVVNPQKRMGAEVKALRHGVADVFPEYCEEPLTGAVISNDTANRRSGAAVDAETEALSAAQSCYAGATETPTSHEIDTTNVSVS
jgi:hypothetical protein